MNTNGNYSQNYFSQAQIPYYVYNFQHPLQMVPRQENTGFVTAPAASPALIKGRPVSSFEEARVAQIDLDGSVFIFPDLGNQKIYTKRINADGTATLNSFTLDTAPIEVPIEYATKNEMEELKATLSNIVEKLGRKKTEINL